MTFNLNDDQVGAFTYVHEPSGSGGFQYNVSVFSVSFGKYLRLLFGQLNVVQIANLPSEEHILTISSVGDQSGSVILFDYLVYT
jgi:hypothetical protein